MAQFDRVPQLPEEAERTELVGDDAARAEVVPGRKRRLFAVGALAIVLVSACVLWTALTPCVPVAGKAGNENSLVSLAENYPQHLESLGVETDEDQESVNQWLVADHKAADDAPQGMQLTEERMQSLEKMMQTKDPEEARNLVDRVIANAVRDSQRKRSSLKAFVNRNRKLKGKKNLKNVARDIAIAKTAMESGRRRHLNPGLQAKTASCTFDVLGLSSTVAAVGANINDALKTCGDVEAKSLFSFDATATHARVCALNVFAILGSVLSLTTGFASASNDCATTMIPNADAMCTASIVGLISAVAGVGGAATLIKAACVPDGWYHKASANLKPSNLGSNDVFKTQGDGDRTINRRLASAELSSQAPPRKLLFGGGKEATETQCAVNVMNSMWALAGAALAINAAGNTTKHSCPPKNIVTGSGIPDPTILYKVPQAMCTVDVSSAIVGFFGAMTAIELAVVNCANELNLDAICASGITGLLQATAGMAKIGSGLYVACDIAQKPPIHGVLNTALAADLVSGGKLTDLADGKFNKDDGKDGKVGKSIGGSATPDIGTGSFGFQRRLEDSSSISEVQVAEIKRQFKTPGDVFKSIGFDFEDKEAHWRKLEPATTNMEELASLAEERKSSALGGFGVCSQ